MHRGATECAYRLDVLFGQVSLVAAYPVRSVCVSPRFVAHMQNLSIACRLGEDGRRGDAGVRVVGARFERVRHVAPWTVQRPVNDDVVGDALVLTCKVVKCSLEDQTTRLTETQLIDLRVRHLTHSVPCSREHLGSHTIPPLFCHFFRIAETWNRCRELHRGRPQVAPCASHAALVNPHGDAHG
jgi:hypothetical protein